MTKSHWTSTSHVKSNRQYFNYLYNEHEGESAIFMEDSKIASWANSTFKKVNNELVEIDN
jgi:hypothetical protein